MSALRNGLTADAFLRQWAATNLGQRHFVSVISLGEIRKGIERLRPNVGGGVNVGWNGRFENRMVRHG
ncbi:MAG: hypothetical protein NTW21_15190 [Verrucomicrobia bacterium]|nr:hypothetical protein [Verrucomicrobiota bacterium]